MRYIIGIVAIALLVINRDSFSSPREEGFSYIPLAGVAALCALASLIASIAYLRTRNLRFDSAAVAAVEAGIAFLAASMVDACSLTAYAGGRLWNWDSGVTAALACWLLYVAYLMLRQAVDEITQRATFAAVWAIFAFLDIPLVAAAASWWKPGVHIPADFTAPRLINLLALALIAYLFATVRFRQEEARRDIDSLRRSTQ
jgi:heme exporter protein C